MKKIIALALVLVSLVALTACGGNGEAATTTAAGETVMSYADYMAADVDDPVVIETYVQAKQSWWDNKATLYTQDQDGAYFIYNMTCSEADYAKLVPGTKIKVSGFKAEWAGEVEIAAGATFEFVEGAEPFVATAFDATSLLGTENLIDRQNQFVAFKGLEVVAYNDSGDAFAYQNTENQNGDLYFKVKLNEETYEFCVESYLCNKGTDVYTAVEGLSVGDIIDVEGFLYWYNGVNVHTTSVTVVSQQQTIVEVAD